MLTSYHDSENKISENQGEILAPSINKLLQIIKPTAQDIFFDLGAGSGKVVMQVFLNSPVKEAHGIEILSTPYQKAHTAIEKVKMDCPYLFENQRKLSILRGSFLEIPFHTATIALINATCFEPTLIWELGKQLNQAPHLHTILSLRPIPSLNSLSFKQAVRIHCSWDASLCYIYQT